MPEFTLKYSDESDLARVIRQAIGADPYEEVGVTTPQFERADDFQVIYFPSTVKMFDHMKTFSDETLEEMGLQEWDDKLNLWLFPCEWYKFIPQGYLVTTINGETKPFELGVTDDDTRFGALAYGIVVSPKQEGV